MHSCVIQRCRLLVAALVASIVAIPVVAQERSPLSIDLTAGAGVGRGGDPARWHGAVAADGVVGWRLHSVGGRHVLLGISASSQGAIGSTDLCEPAPGGGCVPDFPWFHAASVLTGVERSTGGGSAIRLLGGPAQYWVDAGGRAFGIQGRLDFASPAWRGLAFVVSLRGAVLPRFQNAVYSLGSFGFGVRVQ